MADFSRRKMLGGAAGAVTGVVGAGALSTPAAADDAGDLASFVRVSAALTGIAEGKLAPAVDPIQIKLDYFKQAKSDPTFPKLMKIANDPKFSPQQAAQQIMTSPDRDVQFLGRAIILAWYLGAWYPRDFLDRPEPGGPPVPPQKIISPAAYTQAWAYRVAQAHPMGYSELRFGYWTDEPLPLTDLI